MSSYRKMNNTIAERMSNGVGLRNGLVFKFFVFFTTEVKEDFTEKLKKII